MPSTADPSGAVAEPPTAPAQSASMPAAQLAERLAVLNGLAERPLQEHADVYDAVHTDLHAALSEIDDA